MHLTVFAGNGAILLKDYCCIMVQTGSPAFEQACHQYNAVLTGQIAIELGARPRDWLCQREVIDILYLTEVKAVVQFLQYNQLCTLLCYRGNILG